MLISRFLDMRPMLRVLHFTAACLSLLFAAACVTANAAPPSNGTAASDATDAVYRLGLGDRIRITTYGEPTMGGEFQVGGNGSISFPLIGEVPAQDKTTSELEAALVARLRDGYLLDPRVTVEVLTFRPFFILGEIERPGRYPTFEGMTVTRAIATAGGFTYRANKKVVFIRRNGETQERQVAISEDLRIQPGDVLRVGERYF
jgi:polysaccharide export outer membrane protein